MNLTLRVWRQKAAGETGSMVTYRVQDVSPDMSLLEVLDVLNERLTRGYISAPTGAAPDAQAVPVPKTRADTAFDAAICIGCGACVAACPNGSAALFLGAKITHLGDLPQGQAERRNRALAMIDQHDAEGFGGCTQVGECTAVCPKGIQLDVISRYHRDVLAALIHHQD